MLKKKINYRYSISSGEPKAIPYSQKNIVWLGKRIVCKKQTAYGPATRESDSVE